MKKSVDKKDIKSHTLKVANELFQNKGYNNTSMDDIAEKSGISRRTLFRLFHSKSEILFLSSEDIIRDTLEKYMGKNYTLKDIVDFVINATENPTNKDKVNYMNWVKGLRDEPDLQSKMLYKLMEVIRSISTSDDDMDWVLAGSFIGTVIAGWARNFEDPNIDTLDNIRALLIEFRKHLL